MFDKIIAKILSKSLSEKAGKNFIRRLAAYKKIDLMELGMQTRGFLNYRDAEESGERFFIGSFLKERFAKKSNPVFFDVGANIGKYSRDLYASFPDARIISFEPNPHSCKIIRENLSGIPAANLDIVAGGLSSKNEKLIMSTYDDNISSSHASVHSEIFDDMYKAEKQVKIEADFFTLDHICEQKQVEHIDLLKIDTEGHELEVLKGAGKMLSKNAISVIQFEFGDCNVYTRVFLKDFYKILPGFSFYRLNSDGLIPLGPHSTAYEIFQFQNIIALRD